MVLGEQYDEERMKNRLSQLNLGEEEEGMEETEDKLQEILLSGRSKTAPASIFRKEGKEGILQPVIDEVVPIRMTVTEKEFLAELLQDNQAVSMLKEETTAKLRELLQSFSTLPKEFIVDKRTEEGGDEADQPGWREKLSTVLKAITEERHLSYTNLTKKGLLFQNQECVPFKLVYSPASRKFQLAALTVDAQKRLILMNLSGMTEVTAGCPSEPSEKQRILELYQEKKNREEPLVLEVKDKNNAVERCFSMFCMHHKEASYEQDANIHTIKIYYYSFEESELVKDILSLGSAVTVLAPPGIRNQVIERLKLAYAAQTGQE
jgi:hypothetical protein